ncbi:hypothetical protein XENTR_v10004878 [Xenopus tropicalis]|nr:hypothetical protein XENTR_v10004878 [Xenopus tropicalis]
MERNWQEKYSSLQGRGHVTSSWALPPHAYRNEGGAQRGIKACMPRYSLAHSGGRNLCWGMGSELSTSCLRGQRIFGKNCTVYPVNIKYKMFSPLALYQFPRTSYDCSGLGVLTVWCVYVYWVEGRFCVDTN